MEVETAEVAMRFLGKHKAVEAIVDPSSSALSMSRILIGVIVLVYWPMNVLMDVLLHLFKAGKMENWTVLGVMTGAIAGIYWCNSVAGAWRRHGEPPESPASEKHEPENAPPPQPKAKQAPPEV